MDMPEKLKKIFEKRDKRTDMQKEVDKITARMAEIDDPTDEEYEKLTRRLGQMVDIKSKDENGGLQLDPNTVATILAYLAGMVLVIGHETAGHVIYTKAFGLLNKLRF